MKRFKWILSLPLLAFFILFSTECRGQVINDIASQQNYMMAHPGEVTVSLLTCGPGEEVYTHYGHTALRVESRRGDDLTFNYGMFSFHQDNFILRFVFGRAMYMMGVIPTQYFLQEYQEEGRWVRQQYLNLTDQEKIGVMRYLINDETLRYQYNFFYDNCTTRARDAIEKNIYGLVVYPEKKNVKATYRSMIHDWLPAYPWTELGQDILLGLQADAKTTGRQQQFLPDSLSADFDRASIVAGNNSRRELVDSVGWLIEPQSQVIDDSIGLQPSFVFIGLCLFTIFIILVERRKNIWLWGYDVVLLSVTGLAGLILVAMIFSKHPTVQINLQLLVLNPVNILVLPWLIPAMRHRRSHWFWQFGMICIFGTVISFFFQHFAHGVPMLAGILLARNYLAQQYCKPEGINIKKRTKNKK